jgi:hypothetical protein
VGSDRAVSLSPNFANVYLDFLGEYEAICETALAHELGPKGGLFDGKKLSVEYLVTLSLYYGTGRDAPDTVFAGYPGGRISG